MIARIVCMSMCLLIVLLFLVAGCSSPEDLYEEGNAKSLEQKYEDAISCYTKAINKLLNSNKLDYEMLGKLYSKRCSEYNYVGRYAESATDYVAIKDMIIQGKINYNPNYIVSLCWQQIDLSG